MASRSRAAIWRAIVRRLASLAALALAPARTRGRTAMLVGATEDNVAQPSLAHAKAQMDSLALAGFDAVRITHDVGAGRARAVGDGRGAAPNVDGCGALDGVAARSSRSTRSAAPRRR